MYVCTYVCLCLFFHNGLFIYGSVMRVAAMAFDEQHIHFNGYRLHGRLGICRSHQNPKIDIHFMKDCEKPIWNLCFEKLFSLQSCWSLPASFLMDMYGCGIKEAVAIAFRSWSWGGKRTRRGHLLVHPLKVLCLFVTRIQKRAWIYIHIVYM